MRNPDGAGKQLPRFPVVEGYEIDGYLGQGGMGTVYRARRADTGHPVAVKILKAADATGIYRIKREFRVLSDIVHPNLVRLLELNCGAEHWFFTMELVAGRSLLEHLGVQRVVPEVASGGFTAGPDAPTEPSPAGRLRREVAAAPPPLDYRQVRACFAQLAQAVSAIHRESKLHCDIKPSNIMVEVGGRVVVLDFGVSVSLERSQQSTIEGEIGGTPEYMSPEHGAGEVIGPASDWYSVGVVLYETLCGRLPFAGPWREVLRRKQSEIPMRPSALREGVPEDLDALCMALLHTDPERRPSAAQVLDALAVDEERRSVAPRELAVDVEAGGLVGREHELAILNAGLADVKPGCPVVIVVTGDSGIGKSALVQHFLADVARRVGVVTLYGRCYERESVPYNGFDSIIDDLSRFLRRLGDREAADALPRDIAALGRIFPVLQRVPAIAVSRGRPVGAGDLVEVRRRAAAALKELLARLADSWRFVITIDDAQWADEDSVRLLIEILTPPDAPAVLVLASSGGDSQLPISRELLGEHRGPALAGLVRELRLEELPAKDAVELAAALLGDSRKEMAPLLAREACGNPYFVRELALYATRHHSAWQLLEPAGSLGAAARLEPMLRDRLATLTATHRRALDLVAVAGRPLPVPLLSEAFTSAPMDVHLVWQDLRAAHLVRLVGTPDNWSVECYHDRVRDVVLLEVSAEARVECHRALADVLSRNGVSDPEGLLEHYLGAGDDARAREHVLVSAAAAVEALAFARAARLYRTAQTLLSDQEFHALGLGRKLAHVLACDGRLEEAAAAYEQCASHATGMDAVELRRLAAQHYLTGGNGEAGVRALRLAMTAVGLSYPVTPGAALGRLAWERVKLRVRGLEFRERAPSELELARCDVCFSAAVGLSMTDLLRAAVFSVQHLNLAMKAGEPERVARGLTFEMGVAPGAGEEGLRWASRALPVAERLSERHGTAYHRGVFFLAQAHVAYLSGQWRAAVGWVARAEALLTESHVPELHWALLSGSVLSLISSVVCGDLMNAAQRLPRMLSEARQRGEAHRLASIAYPAVVIELAQDRPDAASRLLLELAHDLKAQAFGLREFTLLHCGWLIARYTGRESETWRQLEARWPEIEASKVLVVNIVRVTALAERGSAALAYAAAHKSAAHCRIASRCARQLARERLPHASALNGLLRARLERLQHNPARALSLLNETSFRFDAAGMTLLGHCVRRVAASLMAGSMGAMLVDEADRALRSQGVREPARFAATMVPGFDDAALALPAG